MDVKQLKLNYTQFESDPKVKYETLQIKRMPYLKQLNFIALDIKKKLFSWWDDENLKYNGHKTLKFKVLIPNENTSVFDFLPKN